MQIDCSFEISLFLVKQPSNLIDVIALITTVSQRRLCRAIPEIPAAVPPQCAVGHSGMFFMLLTLRHKQQAQPICIKWNIFSVFLSAHTQTDISIMHKYHTHTPHTPSEGLEIVHIPLSSKERRRPATTKTQWAVRAANVHLPPNQLPNNNNKTKQNRTEQLECVSSICFFQKSQS